MMPKLCEEKRKNRMLFKKIQRKIDTASDRYISAAQEISVFKIRATKDAVAAKTLP